jgi:D-aspartate ligase
MKKRAGVPGRKEKAGAVVIGGDYQGLGIVRSVGRAGYPVFVIDDERSIARHSKYATYATRVRNLRDEQPTIEALLELGSRHGLDGWVLFPTREETVAALSRNRESLSKRFRVPTPGWTQVATAWDKRNTYRLGADLGIPVPRTWYPASRTDLRHVVGEGPFAIKPAIKEHFVYATKEKAWRANDREQLERLFTKAHALTGHGEVMVQELIPGDGRCQFAYCAFFKDGSALGSMVARRRRQHPAEFGRASTYVETIDLPVLEELSTRFLRAIDYYGLVELEYKLDERDGLYKLLDVNARTWGYHTLGYKAGVDFPAMLMADQLGDEVETRRARPGVRWIRLATDLPTAIVDAFSGRLEIRSYLSSLRQADEEAVFSRDDPLPGLAELALIPYLAFKRGF